MTDAAANVRKLLHDAEAVSLLLEIRSHDDHRQRKAMRSTPFWPPPATTSPSCSDG
jgi:hypothetical protein